MKAKRFVAADMRRGLQMVKEHLGEEAVILSSQKKSDGIEIVATTDYSVEDIEQQHAREIAPVASKIYRELTGMELAPANAAERLNNRKEPVFREPEPSMLETFEDQARPSLEKTEVSAMRDELASLREMLSAISFKQGQAAPSPMPAPVQMAVPNVMYAPQPTYYGGEHLSPVQQQIKERLELSGLPGSWHAGILHLLASQPSALQSVKQAWRLVITHLQHNITVAKNDWVDAGGLFAFVGPTGAGKTTTIAKLAARYAMRHGLESVALISLDTQRVGATQQLKAMGKLLGIQVRTADSPNELDVALRVFRKCSLVLIDTAGVKPGSVEQQQLLQCLRVDSRIKTLLTLPATSQYPVLKTQLHCYRSLAKGLVITKTDEAMSLGEAMAAAIDSQLPVVYTTNGQQIPQDISVPDLFSFMKLAVEKIKAAHAIRGKAPNFVVGERINNTNAVFSARPVSSSGHVIAKRPASKTRHVSIA